MGFLLAAYVETGENGSLGVHKNLGKLPVCLIKFFTFICIIKAFAFAAGKNDAAD